MNKDVIYVESEDDITDIILKIEKSKEKIVALVPPKKAGVFRSIVNIKLMVKAAAGAEKTVVLVTVDPSIIKLAAATKIPVAKNLQTAPAVPTLGDEENLQNESVEELADDEEESDDTSDSSDEKKSAKASSKKEDEEDKNEEKDEEDEEEKEDKKAKKDKKPKSKNKFINWIKEHKKLSIFGAIFLVILIGVLVWMFVIAPAVTMKIEIQTTSNNLSENVKFTTVASEENIEEGIFYIEEKTEKSEETVKFNATGKRNNGAKASGEVVVYKYFPVAGTVVISNGLTFSINGLSFTSNGSESLSWSGDITKAENECRNYGKASWDKSGCEVSVRVKVVANEPGTKYNISASESGWSTVANVSGVYSDSSMTGGTDDEKTIVQQSDVNNAKSELATDKEEEYKQKLYEGVGDDKIVIDSSFKQTTSDAVATPNIGEEVGNGVQPNLKITTVSTVYVIDKSKVEEYISKKANLDEGQKIYEMENPNVDGFVQTDKTATGRLKITYYSGPEVAEEDVIEKTKGKGLGEAQQELKNINGIVSVTIDKSYPWVTSIPGDANKITIEFDVKSHSENSDNEKIDENKADNKSDEDKE